ncbi:MAG: DUF1573 domain-containing protein [Bacteroidota bacterium]
MKSKIAILISLTFLVFVVSCKNKTNNTEKDDMLNTSLVDIPKTADGSSTSDLPVLEFDTETHNFENIFAGEVVSYTFKFKNSGKSDLIISDAKATCGCTVPEYPKKPIKPGESSFITVTFNSAGKQGVQNKTITILANTIPNTKVLTITGVVVGGKE